MDFNGLIPVFLHPEPLICQAFFNFIFNLKIIQPQSSKRTQRKPVRKNGERKRKGELNI